jgi:hypothetical protein
MMCGNVLSKAKKLSSLHGEVSAWNECFAVCVSIMQPLMYKK